MILSGRTKVRWSSIFHELVDLCITGVDSGLHTCKICKPNTLQNVGSTQSCMQIRSWSNIRITYCFGLKGTLNNHLVPSSLLWTGTTSTRLSCTKPHPTWSWAFPITGPQTLWQPVPVFHINPPSYQRTFSFCHLFYLIDSIWSISPFLSLKLFGCVL